MTATAEKLKQEFEKLSPGERAELPAEFYQQVRAEHDDDWPMSAQEQAELRTSLKEVLLDFKAGNGIPHEEIVRRFASWGKRGSRQPKKLPLTPAQAAELDRRLADLEKNPGDEMPWEEARKRIVAEVKETGLKRPLGVRLEGNDNVGTTILADSGLSLISGESMTDADQKVVKTAVKG